MATTGPNDRLARVRALAWALDTAFLIPGTNIRFGLDPLIGLVPGLGDLVGVAASGYIMVEAARLGAPLGVLLRMLANIALEGVLGAVPLAGDLFDIAWRANVRNVHLLEQHLASPEAARVSGRRFVVAVTVGLTAIVAGVVTALGVAVWVLLARVL